MGKRSYGRSEHIPKKKSTRDHKGPSKGEGRKARKKMFSDEESGGKRSGFRPEVEVCSSQSRCRVDSSFNSASIRPVPRNSVLLLFVGRIASLECLLFAMEWDPSRFFRPYCSSPYALLVLNQPINESALSVLYEHGELDTGKRLTPT